MSLAPWLDACPIVAILRGIRPEEAEAVGAALLAEGLNILEVPLNSPKPLESKISMAFMISGWPRGDCGERSKKRPWYIRKKRCGDLPDRWPPLRNPSEKPAN